MEFPHTCDCGQVVMIDYLNMERKTLDKIMIAEGYFCEHCQSWKSVFFTNLRLDKKLQALSSVRHKKFTYKFQKAYASAVAAQIVGQEIYGSRNLASP